MTILSDTEMVKALRAGDEAAFASLVERHHPAMVRVARAYVQDLATAEEVAQEAWLGLLRGLDRFEGRSSLKTWIFRILTNQAKSRAAHDRRVVPFSTLINDRPADPAVDPDWFEPADHPQWARWWVEYPPSWDGVPEDRLLATETRAVVDGAIGGLPASQRLVITLRDVEGLTAKEVCAVLDLTESNQRVLLHRARSRVRRVLARYLQDEGAPPPAT